MIKKFIDILLEREPNNDNRFLIPLPVRMRALCYPIVDYKKEYNCDKTINLARGEIRKAIMNPYPDDYWIGKSFSGSYYNGEECTTREIYLGQGYFKLVSRVK